MKEFLILIITVFFAQCFAFGQAPGAINYQAVVRDNFGIVIANQNVSLRMSLHQGNPTGIIVYREVHYDTTNSFGLVSLRVGHGLVDTGIFGAIDWGGSSYFLEIELDENGGQQFISMGTQQLVSVPYALYSEKAGNVFSGEYSDLSNVPTGLSSFSNDVPYLTTEIDADTTNELQDLVISGNSLSITNGNSVQLPHDSITYFTTGINYNDFTNTIRGQWIGGNTQMIVPEDGVYLTIFNARLWTNAATDFWWKSRLFLVNQNSSIGVFFGGNKAGTSASGDATTTGTVIHSFAAGDTLRIDYYMEGPNSSIPYTIGNLDGGQGIHLLKLSE